MKNRMIALLAPIALIGSIFISTAAMAQSNGTPYINSRQENQQQRISQGIRSGELTSREATRLEKQEARIQHEKYEAKKHGRLNRYERAKLNRKLNRENRRIYHSKHNLHETAWAK